MAFDNTFQGSRRGGKYDRQRETFVYYILGHSDEHEKIVTFRVDRMGVPEILPEKARSRPEGFDPVDYTINVFSMYDGAMETVKLMCSNQMMNYVIDRFGDEVQTWIVDAQHFIVEVAVSVSQTFFAWVFQFAGEIKIIGPEQVKDEYPSDVGEREHVNNI